MAEAGLRAGGGCPLDLLAPERGIAGGKQAPGSVAGRPSLARGEPQGKGEEGGAYSGAWCCDCARGERDDGDSEAMVQAHFARL